MKETQTLSEEIVYSRFSCKVDSKSFKKYSKFGVDLYNLGYQQAIKDLKYESEKASN